MMSSFIGVLAVFCAVSWTGFALKCLDCRETNSDTCEGVSVECPNSTQCMVVSELYHPYDNIKHSIKRGCNTGVPCDTVLYISNFVDKEIKTYVQCCSEDDCNTEDYQMPPEPQEHNGKTCPSCYGEGMKECESKQTVTCLNEEDKCLEFIGRFKDPDGKIQERNFMGCASPLVCSLKYKGLIGLEEIQTDTFDCSE